MAGLESKKEHLSFYFVLYIVAMVTVFVIMMERDALLAKRDENIAQLVEIYVRQLHLSPNADTSITFADPGTGIAREPLMLRAKTEGPIDRNDIKFTLVKAVKIHADGTQEEKSTSVPVGNENGDGVLSYPPVDDGVYAFTVAGYKHRIERVGDKMKVKIRDTTYLIAYSPRLERVDRDTTVLLAHVIRSGELPIQLTLNIEEMRDNWVLGVPFKKKIFMGGVEEPWRAIFNAGPGVSFEKAADKGSYVTFLWELPKSGQREFIVTADANRGLGQKDRATTRFTVDVVPPAYVNLPSAKGFWGIPYTFDAQVAGLNPIDITVESFHDGESMGMKPAVPKSVITPDRKWRALSFKVFYRGNLIKEHQAVLSAPPPPQIRWVQQNLDRGSNSFVITAAAADPLGGPVRMSIESQPQGLVTMDKVRGTTFKISVDLSSKPSAIFLKLTATDGYGGTSVSSKQFNIPQ
jgi:hypothetical protein